jgi:FkbH-like protein
MELAEVAASYPEVECLRFPGDDDQAIYGLIERLRDLFGKDRIAAEDGLRIDSIRDAAALREAVERGATDADAFLAQAEAVIVLDDSRSNPDLRRLELVNKTNQFSLNGNRYTEGAWGSYLDDPASFLLAASYRDKYGPLGTISVLAGRWQGAVPVVEVWVLSCRAFSRRIEYRCLEQLFNRLEVEEIAFGFQPTPKNKPIQDFFTSLLGRSPDPGFRLSRASFGAQCPPLHHKIEGLTHA